MGGDEMLVLLPNLGSDLASARLHAHGVGHKLLRALELPIEVDGKSLVVGASVGIALFPKTDGETGEDLVREADTAMYGAKSDTRGTVQFYETAMQQLVTQRLQIDHDLRQALAHDHFDLFIQGKWAPAGGLVGGELLLRWNHPQRGWISPAEFVPIAEESELIVPLGRWVLERACAVAKDLRQTRPDFVLSVNISPKQFRHPEFIDDLQRVVAQAGLSPDALVLEITEGVLLQDQLARHVVALSEAGFRFSLDDFGTGYSSLAYLKRLPVHELKIDRAFVRDIEVDTDDAVLVQAILSIARRFRIQTVAEGVENQAQADFLALHGCDSLQGYHFDRPQPWTAFRDRHLRA
jgi:EAL domain-containing protein (putative c-di-GMP-specific phosphodiesterase class I)